jgi:2-dehydropantoate 2-reductase
MEHAIMGAGAIGGLLGTALGSLGENVTLIVRPEKVGNYPPELVLDRPSGVLRAEAKVVDQLTSPVDVLWIATKTYQLESALAAIKTTPKIIVPLLNGVDHVAVLRQRFGEDRVIPATIAVEAEQSAPGRFVHRSPIRLNIAGSGEAWLGAIVRRLGDLGFMCQFVPDELSLLWGKLCFLEPFALVTSAFGKNLSEIFADPELKRTLHSTIGEACSVAEAVGAKVDPAKIEGAFESLPATMRSSMAKDYAAGRELELDGIAGPILRGAAAHHIAVPFTRRLVSIIQDSSAAFGVATHDRNVGKTDSRLL